MNRRRRAVTVALTAALALALLWWKSRVRETVPDGEPSPAHVAAQTAQGNMPGSEPSSSPALSAADSSEAPFSIAKVHVEKSEVCQGEESLIMIEPQHVDGEDAARRLIPSIGPSSAWATTFQRFAVEPGPNSIRVELFDDQTQRLVSTEVTVLVKECIAPLYFRMAASQDPSRAEPEHKLFRAHLRPGPEMHRWLTEDGARLEQSEPPALPTLPVRYRWEFGDGTSTTTTEPTARHRYPSEGHRDGDNATTFVVSVEALDAKDGVIATARTVVEFQNLFRALKYRDGRVQLDAESSSARTTKSGDTVVDIVVYNFDQAETARIDKLIVEEHTCANLHGPRSGGEPGSSPPSRRYEIAPSKLFPSAVVEPGDQLRGRFVVEGVVPSKRTGTATCLYKFELAGVTSPGNLPVIGFFRADVSPREVAGVVQLDSEAGQLLETVAKHLGRRNFDANDIDRLEREGKIPAGSYDKLIRPPGAGQPTTDPMPADGTP